MRLKKAFTPQQRYTGGSKPHQIDNYEKSKISPFKDKAAETIFGKEGSPQRSYSPFKKEDQHYYNTQQNQSFLNQVKK